MNKPIRQAIMLPNREVVNSAQVGLLLQTAQALVSCLHVPEVEPGRPEPVRLDGGVQSAIEATVINACSRLDQILEESTRWSFEAQNALEKQLAGLYNANQQLIEAQTKLTQHALKPHARYRPRLIPFDRSWAAVLGDIDDLDNAICGIGSTPQEALDAFDGVFTGQIAPHLIQWLHDVEQANLRGTTPPPFKQDNENKSQSVDGPGNSQTKTNESSGSDARSDSQTNGSEQDGSGPPSRPTGSDCAI